jgi:hypothetical protein
MHVILTFLILAAPFAVAVAVSWAADRRHSEYTYLAGVADDPDWYRIQHDADAARTRFEHTPAWPLSGGSSERR